MEDLADLLAAVDHARGTEPVPVHVAMAVSIAMAIAIAMAVSIAMGIAMPRTVTRTSWFVGHIRAPSLLG